MTLGEKFNVHYMFNKNGMLCVQSKDTEKYKRFLQGRDYYLDTGAFTVCNGKKIVFSLFTNLELTR